MVFSSAWEGRQQAIVDLFTSSFAASEGAEEGALIGALARNQMAGAANDRHVFVAEDGGAIVGAAIFTRLRYENDDRVVFVLGPVAVATDRQRRGVGRALLSHGLAALRAAGVDVALTYGDPDYYARVGFTPIDEQSAPPPFKLRQPEGWLGQSLTDAPLTPLKGPSRCVPALDDPAFW